MIETTPTLQVLIQQLYRHIHTDIYIVKVEEVMMYIWIEFYLHAEANLVAARHQVSCSLDSFV